MELQKEGKYDLMYQKPQQLGERATKAIRMFGIKDNQDNVVTDRVLRICKKYIQDQYDSENWTKDIAIEAEEKLDEGDKERAIPKTEVVKANKDMQREKASADDNIPVDLLKELSDNPLKIMT